MKKPTTEYGRHMRRKAGRQALVGAGEAAFGLASTGVGIGLMLSGDVPMGLGGIGAGVSMTNSGVKRIDQARSTNAKGHAVEGRIAQARGGSPALTMAGLSPDKAAAFAAASHQFHTGQSGQPAGSEGDTFTRTRHDARSGKPITETVRKRQK